MGKFNKVLSFRNLVVFVAAFLMATLLFYYLVMPGSAVSIKGMFFLLFLFCLAVVLGLEKLGKFIRKQMFRKKRKTA